MAGHRPTGKVALSVAGAMAGVTALVLWLVPMDELAALAVRPALLTLFKLVAFTAALVWVVLILDAWRLGHPLALNQKHRLIMVGATLAVAALVATPFIVAARYATAAREAVVAMFPSGEVAAASDGRLNILLLGADAGKGRIGLRPDSINVVSIDVRTGKPAMISLPRNLEKARFPTGTPAAKEFPDGFSGDGDRSDYMLNATWTFGEEHPELFDSPSGPGPTAVKQAVEGTLGIPIHYYVAIDLAGFHDLVDAIGGVTIRVNEQIPIGDHGELLKPGLHKLDGYHALWYARSREDSSDYARMARQRCVLGAFLAQTDPRTVLTHFLDLTEASKSVVTTDIPRQALANLVELAIKAKGQELTAIQLVPPLIAPADPDMDVIADRTADVLDGDIEPADRPSHDTAHDRRGHSSAAPAGGGASASGADKAEDSTDQSKPVNVSSVCSYA
jgi:LCP family protein required for cell wall assembly